MPRLFICISLACTLLVTACAKNNNSSNILYGVWVNENLPTDTLRFVLQSGKNMLQLNMSFNTSLPAYTAYEYSFVDGKLSVAMDAPSGPFRQIDSFVWIEQGKTFEILGFQLYTFMSSSVTRFRYRKIS
jgi:hypothetical protein